MYTHTQINVHIFYYARETIHFYFALGQPVQTARDCCIPGRLKCDIYDIVIEAIKLMGIFRAPPPPVAGPLPLRGRAERLVFLSHLQHCKPTTARPYRALMRLSDAYARAHRLNIYIFIDIGAHTLS